MDENIKLNQLVESYAFGFGRIVEIVQYYYFVVRFADDRRMLYTLAQAHLLKFHEEEK